jgi:hypothetical protein
VPGCGARVRPPGLRLHLGLALALGTSCPARLGSGRTVASETEAPNIFVGLV